MFRAEVRGRRLLVVHRVERGRVDALGDHHGAARRRPGGRGSQRDERDHERARIDACRPSCGSDPRVTGSLRIGRPLYGPGSEVSSRLGGRAGADGPGPPRRVPHQAEGLRLAGQREQPAHLGPGQPEGGHHVPPLRRGAPRPPAPPRPPRPSASGAIAPPGSRPDVQRSFAAHRRGVDEGEQQEVAGVLAEVAEEPVPGPAREHAGLGQVHRPEVVADEALDDAGRARGEPQRGAIAGRAISAPRTSCPMKRTRPPSTVRVAGLATSWSSAPSFSAPGASARPRALRRGGVEHPPNGLERGAVREEQRRRPPPHGASAPTRRSDAARAGRCRAWRGSRQQHGHQAEPVQQAAAPGRRGRGQDALDLVPDALGRELADPGRGLEDGGLRGAIEAPARPDRETDRRRARNGSSAITPGPHGLSRRASRSWSPPSRPRPRRCHGATRS